MALLKSFRSCFSKQYFCSETALHRVAQGNYQQNKPQVPARVSDGSLYKWTGIFFSLPAHLFMKDLQSGQSTQLQACIHTPEYQNQQLNSGCPTGLDRRASCIKTVVASTYHGDPALLGSVIVLTSPKPYLSHSVFWLKCREDPVLLIAGFQILLYIKMETNILSAHLEKQDLGFVSLDTFSYSTLLSRSKR